MIVALIHTPLFDIYQKLSKYPRYQRYMKDVKKFISPYYLESERPLEFVRKNVESAGMSIKYIENRERIFLYENEMHLKSECYINIYRA